MRKKNKTTTYDLCRFPEGNTKKIQISLILKYAGYSYGYKLVSVDDEFSKPFRSYSGEGAVFCFICSITEKSKYFSGVTKKSILTKSCDD